MSYTLHLFESASGGAPLMPVSSRIDSLAFYYDEHGAANLRASIPMGLREQLRIYNRPGAPHVVVAYAGAPCWAGRMEIARSGGRALEVEAIGPWGAAMYDNPYTALWAMPDTSQWRPLQTIEGPNAAPGRYEFNTDSQLWITPKRGETHGGAAGTPRAGYLAYQAPDQGARVLTHLEATWNVTAPAGTWQMGINWWSVAPTGSAWTNISNAALQNGTGSGYANTALTGSPVAVSFYFYDTANPGGALAADTGVYSARLTGVRVYSRLLYVYANQIVEAIAAYVNSINPAQLSAVARTLPQVPVGHVRIDEVYDDQWPGDIIATLAKQENYQAWVDLNRTLIFEPAGTDARTYLIRASDVAFERGLSRVRNRVYGKYKEPGGRTLRTAAANDLISQARYGAIRSAPVEVDTTDPTVATLYRDLSLADQQTAAVRPAMVVRRLLNEQGQSVPAHLPRAGDTAIMANLPATAWGSTNDLSRVTIARVGVELERGRPPRTIIEPRDPIPTYETAIAQLDIN